MSARGQRFTSGRGWRLLAVWLALFAATPAVTQPTGDYEVELIVFRRSPEARNTAEDIALAAATWPGEAAFLEAGDPMAVQTAAPARVDESPALTGEADPAEIVELALGSVWRRLERLPAYEPLLHIAWLAEASPRNQALAHPVAAGTAPAPELLGQVRLFRQRSLFLDLELDLRDLLPTTTEPAAGVDTAGQSPTDGFGEVSAPPGQITLSSGLGVFRLRETRKIRPGEIHYFDHPAFGAIATLRSRDPEAEPEDGQTDPGVPP